MAIKATWLDRNLEKYSKRLADIHARFPKVLPQELNKVGNLAKTQVIRNLTAQTGLPRKTIVAAVGNPMKAGPGRLSYDMVTRGGNIRLKYLNPKETEAGVVAKPFGVTTTYPGTFMKGGQFPDRKPVPSFRGHVFFRNGTGRHIAYARSGVRIPVEMQTGQTLDAFNKVAGPILEERMAKLIEKFAP